MQKHISIDAGNAIACQVCTIQFLLILIMKIVFTGERLNPFHGENSVYLHEILS